MIAASPALVAHLRKHPLITGSSHSALWTTRNRHGPNNHKVKRQAAKEEQPSHETLSMLGCEQHARSSSSARLAQPSTPITTCRQDAQLLSHAVRALPRFESNLCSLRQVQLPSSPTASPNSPLDIPEHCTILQVQAACLLLRRNVLDNASYRLSMQALTSVE
eukprot:2989670-Amphidinium_carterae.1